MPVVVGTRVPTQRTQIQMQKTTKGALAAVAAAALLLGGGTTLAYWTDAEAVAGGSISSGKLQLGTPDCGSGWTLDGGAVYTDQLLVPGDVLNKVCTIDLIASGEHLGADLAVSTPAWATPTGLSAELDATAAFTVNGASVTSVDSDDDTGADDEIGATMSVVFDGSTATNGSQNLSAVLNAVSLTATQTHNG